MCRFQQLPICIAYQYRIEHVEQDLPHGNLLHLDRENCMGKTWHFISCYSKQTETNTLATARTQK
jgi:hypothetical protein